MDAKIACATGKATEEDRKRFTARGWETPAVGSLTSDQLDTLKMYSKILNARQLSLKVSANSAYGILGAQLGFIPFIPRSKFSDCSRSHDHQTSYLVHYY